VTMFRNVQLRVKRAIGQDPWLSFPTLPAIYFAGSKVSAQGPSTERQIETAFWESVKERKSLALLATYLERYPSGTYAQQARDQLALYEQQLRDEQAKAMKAAEARRLEEERLAREAALTEERNRLEQSNSASDDAQRAEADARAEQMRQALEEVRIAREAVKKAEEERLTALKAAEEARARAKVASLPAAAGEKRFPDDIASNPVALARALQGELKRVGCDPGEADGNWGPKAKDALGQFARLAKSSVPTDAPSEAALRAVADQKTRICPCASGEKEVEGKCVAKTRAQPAARRPDVAERPASAAPARDPCEGKGWVCKAIRGSR
jgi:hypothetical protein